MNTKYVVVGCMSLKIVFMQVRYQLLGVLIVKIIYNCFHFKFEDYSCKKMRICTIWMDLTYAMSTCESKKYLHLKIYILDILSASLVSLSTLKYGVNKDTRFVRA